MTAIEVFAISFFSVVMGIFIDRVMSDTNKE